MMRIHLGVLALLVAGLCALAPARGDAETQDKAGDAAPKEVVQRLHDGLLESMQRGPNSTFEERFELLEPVVRETQHGSALAQLVLKNHWGDLEKDQKKRFVELLTELSIATYADRFNNYGGESFNIESTDEVRDGVMYVRSYLTKADGERVSLDYVLREFDKGWRIINIIANGVSEVSVKRTEYDAVMKKGGFEELVKKLEEQIAEFREGESDADEGSSEPSAG